MCDPTGGIATLALLGGAGGVGGGVATALAVAGTGLQVYGMVQAGKDQDRIERQNAKSAEAAAADASRRGAIEEDEHRNRVRALLGSQRATFGANNVDSNTGSPLGLLVETATRGELDALTIRNNAARESFGLKTEAKNARARGAAAKKSGMFGGAATALTGGTNAYGIWKQEKRRA